MKDAEKVLDKIHKLHAHAESAAQIGNEAEAEAFAATVARLLTEHKLTMTDVDVASEDRSNPIEQRWVDHEQYGVATKQQRQGWSEQLASIVARTHYCRLVVTSGSNRVSFIGRKEDTAVAEYLYVVLYKTALRLAKEELDAAWKIEEKHGDVTTLRGFKASFLSGFMKRLDERLYAERQKIRREHVGTPGLLRLERDQTALAERMKNFRKASSTSSHRGEFNLRGVLRGRQRADEVSTRVNAIRSCAVKEQAQLPGRRSS